MLELAPKLVEQGRLEAVRTANLTVEEAKSSAEMMYVGSTLPVLPIITWDEQPMEMVTYYFLLNCLSPLNEYRALLLRSPTFLCSKIPYPASLMQRCLIPDLLSSCATGKVGELTMALVDLVWEDMVAGPVGTQRIAVPYTE
ncbi:hypothetical protein FF1_030878 [Malus domestica]